MTAAAKDEPAFAAVTSVAQEMDIAAMQARGNGNFLGGPPMRQVIRTTGGLTKRELAALMAMQGMLANPNVREDLVYCKKAVTLADDLLAELAKGAAQSQQYADGRAAEVERLRGALEEINRDAWSDDPTRLRKIARDSDKALARQEATQP